MITDCMCLAPSSPLHYSRPSCFFFCFISQLFLPVVLLACSCFCFLSVLLVYISYLTIHFITFYLRLNNTHTHTNTRNTCSYSKNLNKHYWPSLPAPVRSKLSPPSLSLSLSVSLSWSISIFSCSCSYICIFVSATEHRHLRPRVSTIVRMFSWIASRVLCLWIPCRTIKLLKL